MKPVSRIPLLATVVTLLLCLALPVLAQNKPSKSESRPKPNVDSATESDPWKRRLAEVQFDNVPLSEVASHLSEQFPEINFVLHPSVKDIPVLLRLRSVTLEDIFTALDIGTQSTGQVIDPATGMPTSGGGVQVNKLNDRMVSLSYGQPIPPHVIKPVCRAFSLSRYLQGKSEGEVDAALNDIEEALQTAWKMLQVAEKSKTEVQQPQLKLHRATKLLIVVGQPAQVEVVEQVINQLEGGIAATYTDAFGNPYGLRFAPGGNPPSPAGVPSAR